MWGHVPVLPLLCLSPEYPAGPHTTPPTLHHTMAPHQGGMAGAGVATRQSFRQSVTTLRYSATQFTLDLRGAAIKYRKIWKWEGWKKGAQRCCMLDEWGVKLHLHLNNNSLQPVYLRRLVTQGWIRKQRRIMMWKANVGNLDNNLLQNQASLFRVYCVIHVIYKMDSGTKTVLH